MCSLFDYFANKLSKDKIVDLSVNIDKHIQNATPTVFRCNLVAHIFARAQNPPKNLSFHILGKSTLLSHVEVGNKISLLFCLFFSMFRLCKLGLLVKRVFVTAKKKAKQSLVNDSLDQGDDFEV